MKTGTLQLIAWRHPKPLEAAGRCVGGRTDLRVDPRRTRRLAGRIAAAARREELPREIWTSPLARCADVGRLLAHRHRFVHRVDARLAELDFGCWDGRPWSAIAASEVARWEADFAHFAPGGGESLAALVARVRDFVGERAARSGGGAVLVVGHAGWIQAAQLEPGNLPDAGQWPAPIRYGSSVRLRLACETRHPPEGFDALFESHRVARGERLTAPPG